MFKAYQKAGNTSMKSAVIAAAGLGASIGVTGSVVHASDSDDLSTLSQELQESHSNTASYGHLRNPGNLNEMAKERTEMMEFETYMGARMSFTPLVYPIQVAADSQNVDKSMVGQVSFQLGNHVNQQGPNSASFMTYTTLNKQKHVLQGMFAPFEQVVTGKYIYAPSKKNTVDVDFAIRAAQPEYNKIIAAYEHKGPSYSAGIVRDNSTHSFWMTSSITNKLSAGMKFVDRKMGEISGVVKYSTVNKQQKDSIGDVVSLHYDSRGEVSGTFVRQFGQQLTLGTNIDYYPKKRESITTIGFTSAHPLFAFRGSLNSEWKARSKLDLVIDQGLRVDVSSELDHATGNNLFGIGVTVGSG